MALLSAIMPELPGGTAKGAGIADSIVSLAVSSGGGPEGQDAWEMTGPAGQFQHTFPDASSATIGVSFKLRIGGYGSGSDYQYMRFDSTTGFEMFRIGLDGPDGQLRVARNTILAGQSTSVMTEGDWVRIMAWVFMNGSTGTVKLWVNDILELNVTGVDTGVSTPSIGKCYVGAGPGQNCYDAATTAVRVCDVVWWDDSGTDFNTAPDAAPTHRTFQLGRLPPDGDDTAVFARSAGSVNADLVDETPPDDDTTYVESSTVTDADILDVAAVPAEATSIFGVFPWAYDNEQGTARSIGLAVKSGTTTSTPTARASAATYGWHGGPGLGEDPDTATTWTPAGVNAAKLVYSVEA